MEKLNLLARIRELYEKGENIIQYLKSLENSEKNSIEDILISYDFQSGSYTKLAEEKSEVREIYLDSIVKVIDGLGGFESIMEVGVGEATTLANVVSKIKNKNIKGYGFDISWSRVKYGNAYLSKKGVKSCQLFTGDLFQSPLKSDSVDIVYTSHSIEPNGGREEEALKELYRITGKYLVLLEPYYEGASTEARARMEKHGYVKNISVVASRLGYNVIENRLFDVSINPLNPTGLIIIKKDGINSGNESPMACPVTGLPLKKYNDCYFSEQSLLAYPIIDGIPCLLPQNAIVATHFMDKL